MAFGNQLYGVTGRRPRPNYEARINAQTPYLPQLYAQRDQDKYQQDLNDFQTEYLTWQKGQAAANQSLQDQQLALSQQGLDQSTAYQNKMLELDELSKGLEQQRVDLDTQQLGLSQDALAAQKDAAKKANKLGYVNLGLTTGLSAAKLGMGQGGFAGLFEDTPVKDTGKVAVPQVDMGAVDTTPQGVDSQYTVLPASWTGTDSASTDFTDMGDASGLYGGASMDNVYTSLSADPVSTGSMWEDMGDAFSNLSTWSGGLTGALAGSALGEAVFGEENKDWARPLGGALTGFGASMLMSGGDWFSGAAGGVLGGLGGLIF